MTAPSTLDDIRQKVRRLTARISPAQLSDVEIDRYINTYYIYDMPEVLRLLKLKDVLTFQTQPLIEVYPFPNDTYVTIEGPLYIGGQQAQYFQDNDMFYREWPKNNYIQQISTGNGGTGPYIGTLSAKPILRSVNVFTDAGKCINVVITANLTSSTAVVVTDDGFGGFIDPNNNNAPVAGTIDYSTGQFNITFNTVIPAGAVINAEYIPFVASLPRTMCYYQNQFFFRPVPDKAYTVQINAFRIPTTLMNGGDNPELKQWWQLLAYGAALKILEDNADFENVQNYRPFYVEQLLLVQRKTIKQLTNQRAATIYSNQGMGNFSNLYPYI